MVHRGALVGAFVVIGWTVGLAATSACVGEDAPGVGEPSSGCPIGCLRPPPATWTGPSAIYDGPDKPTSCPKDYTVEELVGRDDIRTSPPTCTCGAPVFAKVECTYSLSRYDNTECNISGGGLISKTTISSATNACESVGVATRVNVRDAALTPTTCSFGPSPKPAEPLAFGRTTVACGLPQVAACKDRSDCTAAPLPDGTFSRLCIHKAGLHDCPSPDYATRLVTFATVTDGRACSDCKGGTATGKCGDTYETTTAACAGTVASAKIATCVTPADALNLGKLAPQLACPTTEKATPNGTATLDGPVTFCCTR